MEIGKFCDQQKHITINDDLPAARTVSAIFGAFTNQEGINKSRFTLTNNNKKIFFKLLHKQFYEKLANNDIKTFAIGQELNGIHKIVVDIDCKNSEECMFPIFTEVGNILAELFQTDVRIFAREANKDGETYKHGCHIIINAYVDSKDNQNTYQHIIRHPRIAQLIDMYGNTFIDPAVFRNHQLFWIFGGCKNGSNMYMELKEGKLYNPYEKYIDCGLTFDEFCQKNPNFNFDIELYDTIGIDQNYIPTFEPPVYIEEREDEYVEYTGDKLDIKYLSSLLELIDGCKTEYHHVRLPIVLGVAREYNSSKEAWNILLPHLQNWNCQRGENPNYHIKELEHSYFNGVRGRQNGFTMGTIRFIAKEHNPEKYEEWCEDVFGIDWNIYSNECEFDDDEINIVQESTKKKDLKNDMYIHQKVLNNIVKSIMKDKYNSEDDYIEDRNNCLNKFIKYAKDRLIFLQNPSNVVWCNNIIVRKNDFERTFEGFGKIGGSKEYFVKPFNNLPSIDFAKYMNKYKWRTFCDRTDFIPINGIPEKRIVEIRGEKILNTFIGYNTEIYSTEPIPDLKEYEEIINDFIINKIGDKINKECIDYINSHPIWIRPIMLAMLNISGSISDCEYVKKYIAQIIQEPSNLLPIGLLFFTKCRQGKGMLTTLIRDIVRDDHVIECNTKEELFGTHAVPFENRLVVNINEAQAGEFGKNIIDIMKSYIDGSKTRTANRKNIQAYQYTMKSRIIATTNNIDGFSFDIQNGNGRINAFKGFNYLPIQYTRCFLEKTFDVFRKSGWYYRELYNYFNKIEYTSSDILEIRETEYMKSLIDAEVDPILEWLKNIDYDSTLVNIWRGRLLQEIHMKEVSDDDRICANGLYQSFLNYYTINRFGVSYSTRKFYLKIRSGDYNDYIIYRGLYNGYKCYSIINRFKCELSDDK